MTYDQRLKDIIVQLTKTARAELDTTDVGRFKRVKILCEHAEDLLRETVQSVEDFEALEEDDNPLLGPTPYRRRRRWRQPRPGVLLPDNVGVMRTAMESLGQQNSNLATGNKLKTLDLVLRMKKEGLDEDPELKEIYKEVYDDLVHPNVLRRLSLIDAQRQDEARGDTSNGSGEETT